MSLSKLPWCDPDSIVLTFPVAQQFAGQRLDRFIQARIPRLSRTRAQEIIRACARHEDGSARKPSDRVKSGEVVLLVRPKLPEPEPPGEVEVLHDDGHVFAINKPPGLPMHPSASYHRYTLTYVLRLLFGHSAPRIAHRLDRETSGLVVCGRTLEAERHLKKAFENREVAKTYLALVRGSMDCERGEITLPISPVTDGLHIRMEVRDRGSTSHAHTEYEVLARRDDTSLVLLRPHTGRQHQLRVHLSAIGHPIVGDKLYGPEKEAPFLELIETGMTESLRSRLGHDRHALHAYSARFAHPAGGETTLFAPWPSDLETLWGPLPATPPLGPMKSLERR